MSRYSLPAPDGRLIGVLIALVALGVLLTVRTSLVPSAESRTMIFRDESTGRALAIETASSRSDAGSFSFATPNGVYSSVGVVSLTESGDQVTVSYRGQARLQAAVGERPTLVTVRLEARIDRTKRTVAAALTPGETEGFALVKNATQPGTVRQTIQRFQEAMKDDDWVSVLALLDPFFADGYRDSPSTFIGTAAAATVALGPIVGAVLKCVSDVRRNNFGDDLVVAVHDVTREGPSGRVTKRFETYLRAHGSDWRVWFTREVRPPFVDLPFLVKC